MVPLMLNEVSEGRLKLERLVNATSEAPATRLGLERGKIIEDQTADFMIVDMKKSLPIKLDRLHSRSNWTPFENWPAIFPSQVYRRGELIAEHGEIKQEAGGQNLF